MARNPDPFRDVREVWPIRGIGGFMEVEWANADSNAPSNPVQGKGDKLEIQEWRIDHKYINARLPISGGKGSPSKRRVCDDFTWAAKLNFDLLKTLSDGIGVGFGHQPFVDGQLEGKANPQAMYHLGIRFQCGDPTWYSDDDLQSVFRPPEKDAGVFYFCPRVILTNVETINNAKGGTDGSGLVHVIARGEGSAPLERWIGPSNVGKGGLGFDQPK